MRRWGQIAEAKPDSWYDEVAKSVYKPEIYLEAARMLVDEGLANEADFPWDSDGYKARPRPRTSSTASPMTAARRTPISTACRSA